MTLVEFLQARLDEREQTARAVLTRVCRWPKSQPRPWDRARLIAAQLGKSGGVFEAWEGRETPDEVLADVDAKRRIIAQAFRHEAKIDGEWGCVHSAADIEAGKCEETPVAEIALLRLLALPYRDHPDYQPEWAPN